MKLRTVQIKKVTYYQVDCGQRDGKRFRRTFGSESEAKRFLREEEARLRSHGTLASTIPVRQLLEMVDCWDKAKSLGVSIRALLEKLERGEADFRLAAGGVTLRDALDALLKARARDTSRGYQKNLRMACERFVRGREAQPIGEVTHDQIQEWLDLLGHSNGGAAYRVRLGTLFGFAKRQGWLVENPMDRLERIRAVSAEPTVFSPMQWGRVLCFVRRQRPDYLPWFILAGMEGLRPFEADQVTLDDLDLTHGLLTVRREISKTGRRRVIELQEHTVEWLRWSLANGGQLGFRSETRVKYCSRVAKLALRLPAWPKDVLRHTVASILCAIWKDVPKVALHLGNSVPVVMRHYNNAMPEVVARRYTSYRPVRNVRAMRVAAA